MASHASSRDSVQPRAAALTVNATKTRNTATASLTGGPAAANVTFAITHNGVQLINALTDGTGAATVSFVPGSPGLISVTVTAPQPATAVFGPVTANVV